MTQWANTLPRPQWFTLLSYPKHPVANCTYQYRSGKKTAIVTAQGHVARSTWLSPAPCIKLSKCVLVSGIVRTPQLASVVRSCGSPAEFAGVRRKRRRRRHYFCHPLFLTRLLASTHGYPPSLLLPLPSISGSTPQRITKHRDEEKIAFVGSSPRQLLAAHC